MNTWKYTYIMQKIFLITGPGGSGKTTIAQLLVKQGDFLWLDGDSEDTEFFPEGGQWLPGNAALLKKAHEKILHKAKELWSQQKNVVVDYIIFGQYEEFFAMFQREFGKNLERRILLPRLEECVKRDAQRACWTTGSERILAVSSELLALKEKFGAAVFLDTSGQTPEETVEKYFQCEP